VPRSWFKPKVEWFKPKVERRLSNVDGASRFALLVVQAGAFAVMRARRWLPEARLCPPPQLYIVSVENHDLDFRLGGRYVEEVRDLFGEKSQIALEELHLDAVASSRVGAIRHAQLVLECDEGDTSVPQLIVMRG
jgi:hypothetical protein